MRDTKFGEPIFGCNRWVLDPDNLDLSNEIATALSDSFFGMSFDLRVIRRSDDKEEERTVRSGERITEPVSISSDGDRTLVVRTDQQVFQFNNSSPHGPAVVTELGSAFHIYVPKAYGMKKFIFYNARQP